MQAAFTDWSELTHVKSGHSQANFVKLELSQFPAHMHMVFRTQNSRLLLTVQGEAAKELQCDLPSSDSLPRPFFY